MSQSLGLDLNLILKRTKLVKHELLRPTDRWGKQLPNRLLATLLSYASASDLARSQCVCGGWRFSREQLDRLWRGVYELDYEGAAVTGESKQIAVAGAATAWSERYKRRQATEANWWSGTYRLSKIQLDREPWVMCQALDGKTVVIGCYDAFLLQIDTA